MQTLSSSLLSIQNLILRIPLCSPILGFTIDKTTIKKSKMVLSNFVLYSFDDVFFFLWTILFVRFIKVEQQLQLDALENTMKYVLFTKRLGNAIPVVQKCIQYFSILVNKNSCVLRSFNYDINFRQNLVIVVVNL